MNRWIVAFAVGGSLALLSSCGSPTASTSSGADTGPKPSAALESAYGFPAIDAGYKPPPETSASQNKALAAWMPPTPNGSNSEDTWLERYQGVVRSTYKLDTDDTTQTCAAAGAWMTNLGFIPIQEPTLVFVAVPSGSFAETAVGQPTRDSLDATCAQLADPSSWPTVDEQRSTLIGNVIVLGYLTGVPGAHVPGHMEISVADFGYRKQTRLDLRAGPAWTPPPATGLD